METLVLVLFFLWGLPTLITWNIGAARGRTGWRWGFFLGWLGVLILACMRPLPAAEQPPVVEREPLSSKSWWR